MGVCSRREADRLIEAGRVSVDGKTAIMGQKILSTQKVQINGKNIKKEEEKVLENFIELLAELNGEAMYMLETGDLSRLYDMNDTVEGIYAIQSASEDELYAGIKEEAGDIYQNFNALVMLVQKIGDGEWTEESSALAQLYLSNILEANVAIVKAYGLAE